MMSKMKANSMYNIKIDYIKKQKESSNVKKTI